MISEREMDKGTREPVYAASAEVAQSWLQEIASRIYSVNNSITEICGTLEEHAAAVYGETPDEKPAEDARVTLPGQLGSIIMALETLEAQTKRLNKAARRNTQLAY
jgi:hypothetical protein